MHEHVYAQLTLARSGATRSTLLFVGVKYVVSATSETTSIAQGKSVTLTGSVAASSPGQQPESDYVSTL